MGFAAFGVFLLAKRALQHFLERKRRHELQKRVHAAAAQRQAREAEGGNGTSDVDSNNKKDQLVLDICVICLEQEYNAVFVPCGHMCCCMNCSSHLTNCPLCRRRIDQAVRTFRHWQHFDAKSGTASFRSTWFLECGLLSPDSWNVCHLRTPSVQKNSTEGMTPPSTTNLDRIQEGMWPLLGWVLSGWKEYDIWSAVLRRSNAGKNS